MTSPRETFMAAAAQSLQDMWPTRFVKRGLVDPAKLGDPMLRQGVYALIAAGTDGWTEFTGREAQYGTLEFAICAWCLLEGEDTSTERLEQLEAELEDELLQWCQAIKSGPLLDAVYPVRVTYSGGLDCPYGWLVMRLKAIYV